MLSDFFSPFSPLFFLSRRAGEEGANRSQQCKILFSALGCLFFFFKAGSLPQEGGMPRYMVRNFFFQLLFIWFSSDCLRLSANICQVSCVVVKNYIFCC